MEDIVKYDIVKRLKVNEVKNDIDGKMEMMIFFWFVMGVFVKYIGDDKIEILWDINSFLKRNGVCLYLEYGRLSLNR